MTEQPIEISTIWPDAEDQPVLRANQFVTQLSGGPGGRTEEIILVVGHVAPPLILGAAEEQHAMLSAMGAVSVHALGRYSLSRGRLQELIELLQNAAVQWDSEGGAR